VHHRPKVGDRKGQIVRTAGALFAKHGFERASVRLIATACGITEAAIYRHFDSKAQLYEEVIRRKADQHDIAGSVAALAGRGSLEDLLTGVANYLLRLAADDPELMRLMTSSSLEGGAVATVLFREIRLPVITFVAHELEARIASGEVVDVDPYITSRCFVGMVMDCGLNINVWEKITDSQFQADDVVCNNVPIFARGLLKSSGR